MEGSGRKFRVLIFGHSYIDRLERFINSGNFHMFQYNSRLQSGGVHLSIEYIGIGGLKIGGATGV
jgi:hypothetical protein